MNITNELFTLETLGKFYTDAAKTSGIQRWCWGYWAASRSGPNIGDRESDYRPKPAPPTVRWVVKFDDGTTYRSTFETEKQAIAFIKINRYGPAAKVIKLVEEQT